MHVLHIPRVSNPQPYYLTVTFRYLLLHWPSNMYVQPFILWNAKNYTQPFWWYKCYTFYIWGGGLLKQKLREKSQKYRNFPRSRKNSFFPADLCSPLDWRKFSTNYHQCNQMTVSELKIKFTTLLFMVWNGCTNHELTEVSCYAILYH